MVGVKATDELREKLGKKFFCYRKDVTFDDILDRVIERCPDLYFPDPTNKSIALRVKGYDEGATFGYLLLESDDDYIEDSSISTEKITEYSSRLKELVEDDGWADANIELVFGTTYN